MKRSVSIPDSLYNAINTVYFEDNFSKIVQAGLIALLERDGFKVTHIPESYEITKGG